MKPDVRLIDLVCLYRERELSSEEHAELITLLKEAPEALELFRNFLEMDWHLRTALDPDRSETRFLLGVRKRFQALEDGDDKQRRGDCCADQREENRPELGALLYRFPGGHSLPMDGFEYGDTPAFQP